MITINKSTTDNTVNYYYDIASERFGDNTNGFNHGFSNGNIVKIIVDSGLYAHELDVIFDEVLKKLC